MRLEAVQTKKLITSTFQVIFEDLETSQKQKSILKLFCDPSVPTEEFFGSFGPEVRNGVEHEFPGWSRERGNRALVIVL